MALGDSSGAVTDSLPCRRRSRNQGSLKLEVRRAQGLRLPAPPNYHLRDLKYQLMETIRPLIAVIGGCWSFMYDDLVVCHASFGLRRHEREPTEEPALPQNEGRPQGLQLRAHVLVPSCHSETATMVSTPLFKEF